MTTTIEKPALVYVTFIKTTPKKLWEALTNPDFIEKYWYGCRNESDLRVGSEIHSYSAGHETVWRGKILECEAPRLLSYTFDKGNGEAPSRVTFEIAWPGDSEDEPVRLTITHDEFAEGSEIMTQVSNGWPGIIAGLKTLLETGMPLGLAGRCGC